MFNRKDFNPVPEKGDLIIGDGYNNICVDEVQSKGLQGEYTVVCNDDEIRHIIPMWTSKDEEEETVAENHWWQDCNSRAVPWWE